MQCWRRDADKNITYSAVVRNVAQTVSFYMRKVMGVFLFLAIAANILYSVPAYAWYYADLPISVLVQSSTSNERIASVSPFVLEEQEYQTVARAAAQATPAVVSIIGRTENERSVGSGFIFTRDGYVLTNKHVVPYITTRYIAELSDGTRVVAEVVYRDPDYDIAVVKIEGTFDEIIPLGTIGTVDEGEAVAAIGNVMGLYNNTVSTGTVEGFNRVVKAEDHNDEIETLTGLIETDAFITPGFSGGPLIDESGHAVGMNVATSLTEESSFAIPIDFIQERIESVV
jgi:S1-C subfamily serine protease